MTLDEFEEMVNRHDLTYDYSDDGGPAFPTAVNSPGMSLRDWFAGQAISSVLNAVKGTKLGSDVNNAALLAYTIADAMLEQRKK